MRNLARAFALLSVLSLQACADPFAISDSYGNSYGAFYDFGNRYAWQLSTCQNDPALAKAATGDQKRWMECCMWRHGVPIDDDFGRLRRAALFQRLNLFQRLSGPRP